jgi:hypothetical protein
LNIQDFTQLIEHQHENSISIYMPTYRMGKETKQNPIRFKNLLAETKNRLIKNVLSQSDTDAYLKPLQELIGQYGFWQNQLDGLAIFHSPEGVHSFRLPLVFDEIAVIDRRFHIKPLIPLFSSNDRFYALALSQNHVRFFTGTRFGIEEIDLGDTPTSMAEALEFDDPEKQLQFHSSTSPSRGKRNAMFHGHDPDNDDAQNIIRFFRQVNRGVMERIGDQTAPLVLVGVDYLLPLYAEANTYAHLAENGVTGNPDELHPDELHKAAWEIIAPQVRAQYEKSVEKYQQIAAKVKATTDLAEIIPAAYHARIDTIFVTLGNQVWGSFDPATNKINLQEESNPQSRDLLDLAALHTLLNGGAVYAVHQEDMPEADQPIAAILRY